MPVLARDKSDVEEEPGAGSRLNPQSGPGEVGGIDAVRALSPHTLEGLDAHWAVSGSVGIGYRF
jgi:hypothetical protein